MIGGAAPQRWRRHCVGRRAAAIGRSAASAGFTVLEVLVSVAILGAALAVLLGLVQATARAALGVERAAARLAQDRAALDYLRGVNPSLTGAGETPLGAARLTWRAVPVAPPRPIVSATGSAGRFVLQRYRIEATIAGAEGTRAWSVEVVGWRPLKGFAATM